LVFFFAPLVGRIGAADKADQPSVWSQAANLALQAVLVAGLLWVVVSPSAITVAYSWRGRHITFLSGTDYAEYPYPVDNPAWPHEFAASLAAQVEDNAIVFTGWDTLYPVLYVTHIEQGRNGIEAHETYPSGSHDRLQDSAVSYILANLGKRPIYFTNVDRALAQDYNFVEVDGQLPLYRLEKR